LGLAPSHYTAADQPTNSPAAANPQILPSHGKTTLPLLLLLLTLSDPFPPHLPDAAGDATAGASASGSVDLVADFYRCLIGVRRRWKRRE
jgi:hypothetical protein